MTRKNIDTSNECAVSHNDSMVSNSSQSMTDAVNQTGIFQQFSKVSELYSSEAEVLGAAIRLILAKKGTVTHKAIIMHLINQLETTSDVVQLDILRGALEMVLGMMPDDALRDPHKSALINQHHILVGSGEVIKNGAQHRSF